MRGTPHTTRWEYPGGGLDEGETTLAAAIRETREEACCVAQAIPGLCPQVAEPTSLTSPRRGGPARPGGTWLPSRSS